MTLAAALTWIVLGVGLTFALLYLTSEWWLRH
jgi:hypothetical protein